MRRWWALTLAALSCAGLYFAIQHYRYRFVQSDTDLLDLLPPRDATLLFANVTSLHEAHYLALLTTSRTQQDRDYLRFVSETGFDYTRDLASLAASLVPGHMWLAARGDFHWSRIERYVGEHGGSCHDGGCNLPATGEGGRWISLRRIQPDVIALAVSPDASGASEIGPHRSSFALASPAPIWLRPAQTALSNPADLPLPVRIYAISLQSAQAVVLSAEQPAEPAAAFDVRLDATFENAATADTAHQQLSLSTRLLRAQLNTNSKALNPGTLEWLLLAGTFQANGNHLSGHWPIRRELLNALR